MSKPFSHLESLISNALQQQSLPLNDRDIDDIVIRINKEKQRILTTVYDEQDMEAYIPARQHQLVRLIDQMLDACPVIAMDHTYKNIYRSLMELLQFLERNFAAYMDEDCKVPFIYLLNAQIHLSADIKDLEMELACNENFDAAFAAILITPFYKLLSAQHPQSFYSYYHIVYLRRLLNQLLQTPHEEWRELLVYFDFNDPVYVAYLKVQIKSEIIDMPADNIKRETLFAWQKALNQAAVYPGMHYNKLHRSLRKQLDSWISEELSWLDKNEMNDMQFANMDLWKDYKVHTNLTVPQFGRFIGLLLEEKIILNENKKELAIFFTLFFTSMQSEHIAPGNLRNSFYDTNAQLVKSLDIILKNLQKLNGKDN